MFETELTNGILQRFGEVRRKLGQALSIMVIKASVRKRLRGVKRSVSE